MTIDDIEGDWAPVELKGENSNSSAQLHAEFHQLYTQSLKQAEETLARLNQIRSN